MVKNLRNKLMLGLMVIVVEVTAAAGGEVVVETPTQPSTMQNVYNSVAARLSQAKNAAANLLFSDAHADNVPTGMTIPQAFLLVQQLIINKPKGDDAALDTYWQTKSSLFLKCAKLLPEETEKQILSALQEIDKRLLYWFYQRDHQWQYFFSKNPLKWVMGKKQDVEIETNIEQLHSKQDELYVRLGELSSIDWHQYLVAMHNHQAAYAWIDTVLNIISGTKEESAVAMNSDNYGAIVIKLYEELRRVGIYATTILSALEDTALPHYIARNWVKYGALILAGRWAYNSDTLKSLITPEAIAGYQKSAEEYVVTPAQNIINKVFFQGVTNEERESLQKSLGTLLDKVAPKEKVAIMNAEKVGNLVRLGELYDNLPKHLLGGFFMQDNVLQIGSILARLTLYHLADQFSVVQNVALLTPAAFVGWAGYRGYERLTQYDYTPIRLALVAISSLFVDTTKPLDDLEYGKMIFLIYNLKEKAQRDLPVKNNVRADFIKDLERIESREFDSAAKRRIIKDMFKKYSFLGLVQ